MMRVVTALVGIVAMFAILAAGLVIWRDRAGLARPSDTSFADALFSGVVPYDRVIYSDSGGPTGRVETGCQVAAVRLLASAPAKPPRADYSRPEHLQFGGAWQSTPLVTTFLTVSDPLTRCIDGVGPDIASVIRSLKDADGAWYARRPGGQVVFIYAPAYGIAARISLAK
jgi:hypothetical protein